ncbi:excisionase family DNA-binding protein [Sporocytophaga myxococcoides]|uniref:excisionase family DNA-binding protein n=1 Tax=Sporocytophaga myxococcoides TaxID=153721 RepID=UPI0005EE552C|nr:helix-turn-helix domain-containing protein [Sporocytophaga myxococcoides]
MQKQSLSDTLSLIQQVLLKLYINNKNILTFEEALIYLNVSDSFLYKKTYTNAIPHYQPSGKLIYFKRDELDHWLLQNKVKSNSEIDNAANTYILSNKKR